MWPSQNKEGAWSTVVVVVTLVVVVALVVLVTMATANQTSSPTVVTPTNEDKSLFFLFNEDKSLHLGLTNRLLPGS
jgi:anti-sigma-K factor RskA